jgi:hypothetical protein
MSVNPAAVAVQGIGYGALSMALNGWITTIHEVDIPGFICFDALDTAQLDMVMMMPELDLSIAQPYISYEQLMSSMEMTEESCSLTLTVSDSGTVELTVEMCDEC